MNDLRKKKALKIGLVPNQEGENHPADRRRFSFFLRRTNREYEIAKYEKHYDILLLTIGADLTRWVSYKDYWRKKGKKPVVVFDLSDSYLFANKYEDIFRASFHFVTGRASRWNVSYSRTLLKMVSESDAVTCASVEQKIELLKITDNVHVITDFFSDDIDCVKTNSVLSEPGTLNVVWEGLSHGNENIFRNMKKIFKGYEVCHVKLHIITDPTICSVGGRFFCRATTDLLDSIFRDCNVKVHFYSWDRETFSSIITACDVAIIPVPATPMMFAKAESKLLLFMKLGVPTITTNTPSYYRVVKSLGLSELACEDFEDWRSVLKKLFYSEEYRHTCSSKGRSFMNEFYSDHQLLERWEKAIFQSEKPRFAKREL